MKIMYCTSQFYEHGGIEKILSKKINYWIQNFNYEIILCTSEHKNNNFVYDLDSKINHVDLKVNYYRTKSYFHPLNLIKSIQHFIKLRHLINKTKPDVIISVNYTPEQYFIPLLAKNTPTIKEFHSSGVTIHPQNSILEKGKHFLFQILDRYTVKVVLNPDEVKYYPFKNIEVIPNFIETKKFEQQPKENIIIAAGRIAPVKQFDHLIKAWSLIANQVPNWEVHLYGEGDEILIQQLQSQINYLELPRIILKGATQELDKKMQSASIYAMTSKTECFPMVLLEAMAVGMVIISYDCPNGPRNIITNNKDGILVDQEPKYLAKKILEIIKNESERIELSNNAKINVEKFNTTDIMQTWLKLISNL